jgi:hypothetical protein
MIVMSCVVVYLYLSICEYSVTCSNVIDTLLMLQHVFVENKGEIENLINWNTAVAYILTFFYQLFTVSDLGQMRPCAS